MTLMMTLFKNDGIVCQEIFTFFIPPLAWSITTKYQKISLNIYWDLCQLVPTTPPSQPWDFQSNQSQVGLKLHSFWDMFEETAQSIIIVTQNKFETPKVKCA